MEERSEKCMRRENEHEKKQNGYCEQDMVDQIALIVRKYRGTGQSETGKYRTVTKREKAEETFSFIPDRTCSSLCSSCNGNHSVAVWKPASWNDRL